MTAIFWVSLYAWSH